MSDPTRDEARDEMTASADDQADPTEGAPTTVEELIRTRLSTAIGGLRGSLEATAPMLVFVILWSATRERNLALGAAIGLIVLMGVARAAQRQSQQFVFSSVIALALGAFFALRSGNAEDAFLPGILVNIGYGIGSLLSVVLRWPVVGLMIGATDPAAAHGDFFRWRRSPAAIRVCSRLTLVLVAVYAARVFIMGPLYLAGNIAGLTVTKIVLGWPLWATAIGAMGFLLLRGKTPLAADDVLLADPAGVDPVDADPAATHRTAD